MSHSYLNILCVNYNICVIYEFGSDILFVSWVYAPAFWYALKSVVESLACYNG